MHVSISPSRPEGTVAAPPSKSAALRHLVCAGLAAGEKSVISGLSPSQDILAAVDCLRALGAEADFDGRTAEVTGTDPKTMQETVFPCRECASALRFFIPVALLSDRKARFTGGGRLFLRPLSVYEDVCREQGLLFSPEEDSLTVRGRLASGKYSVPGDISSQFISGLCFALPLLDGNSTIGIKPPLASRPYVEMTLDTLSVFGVTAGFNSPYSITVPGGQRFRGSDAVIEGDWSNAAFFDALNLLGGSVQITGLKDDSLQGDRAYTQIFAALAAGTPEIDLTSCPDLGPVCMALAGALNGARFTGTARLRMKESDRCAAMAEELAKFGVRCEMGEDDMTVRTADIRRPEIPLLGHGDHRVVMALSVLTSVTGGIIEGAEAVEKSMPDFFSRLPELGVGVSCGGPEGGDLS